MRSNWRRSIKWKTLLAKPAAERKPDDINKLLDWWLATVDETSRGLDAQLKLLEQQETQIKGRGTIALVMNEKQDEAGRLRPLPRRIRSASRCGESQHARLPCRKFAKESRSIAWDLPIGYCRRIIRSQRA